MGRNAIVAGTGFEGRASIIRRHCKVGSEVVLKREPNNQHDSNAVAIYLVVPRFFGILGDAHKQIGYIKKNTAKSLAKKMDAGVSVSGTVKSYFAPDAMNNPRVTLELDY